MGFIDALLEKVGKDRGWLIQAAGVDKAIVSRMNGGNGGTYPVIRRLAPFLNETPGNLAEMYEQYRIRVGTRKMAKRAS